MSLKKLQKHTKKKVTNLANRKTYQNTVGKIDGFFNIFAFLAILTFDTVTVNRYFQFLLKSLFNIAIAESLV